MDKVALKAKIDEILNAKEGDKETDPFIAERVNQIANDAIASMPEQPEQASDPEKAMMEKLKAQVETIKEPPELVEKLQAIVATIETAVTEDAKKPVPQA